MKKPKAKPFPLPPPRQVMQIKLLKLDPATCKLVPLAEQEQRLYVEHDGVVWGLSVDQATDSLKLSLTGIGDGRRGAIAIFPDVTNQVTLKAVYHGDRGPDRGR